MDSRRHTMRGSRRRAGAPAVRPASAFVVVALLSSSAVAALPQSDPALTADTVDQLRVLLTARMGFFVLGATFLVCGLGTLLLGAVRREFRNGIVLLFGIMSLLWGLRFVSRAPVVPLVLGGDPETWALFTRGLAYFSAPPALAFVWQLFGRGWKSSVRVATWVSLAFAVVAALVLALDRDPERLLRVFNGMIVVAGAAVVTSLLQPECRRHPELKILVGGGLCSLAFIVVDNLSSLGLIRARLDVEWIGVVILFGTLGYMAAGHVITAERRLTALQQELAIARRIQFSILPPAPPATTGLAIATRYVPMTEVAGDFFDFAKIGANRCGCLIADVSGHGVPAALVAAMVKVAFQAQAAHRELPDRVLAGMNEMLGHRLEGQFVTAGYAFVDAEAGNLRYAGAGHPPLFLLSREGEVRELFPEGLMLGPFPEAQYAAVDHELAPGDRILMYTDGVVETFNRNDEEFGSARLIELLRAGAAQTGEEMADHLLSQVRSWAGVGGEDSLEDDLTLVVIDVLETGRGTTGVPG